MITKMVSHRLKGIASSKLPGVVREAGKFMVCMLKSYVSCAQRAGDFDNSSLEKEAVGAGALVLRAQEVHHLGENLSLIHI